jgi:hypothetical protein
MNVGKSWRHSTSCRDALLKSAVILGFRTNKVGQEKFERLQSLSRIRRSLINK